MSQSGSESASEIIEVEEDSVSGSQVN